MKSSKETPLIRWEMNAKDDRLPLRFNGVPYIWMGELVQEKYFCLKTNCLKLNDTYLSIDLSVSLSINLSTITFTDCDLQTSRFRTR